MRLQVIQRQSWTVDAEFQPRRRLSAVIQQIFIRVFDKAFGVVHAAVADPEADLFGGRFRDFQQHRLHWIVAFRIQKAERRAVIDS